MKAAVYYGPGDIRVEEKNHPSAGEEGMVLKVGACGICPLIDVPHYKMEFPLKDIPAGYTSESARTSGLILGHEFSGEVVEIGSKVTAIEKGERIYGVIWKPCGECEPCVTGDYENCLFGDGGGRAFDGAMAEYVLFPNVMYSSVIKDKFVRLPEELSYRDGALIEILRLGIGLASKAKTGDTVVVFGQDLIGLTAVLDLKAMGAAKVIACDVSEKRLQAAEEVGADVIVNTLKEDVLQVVLEETSGKCADVVIESSCRPENLQNSLNVVRPFGDIWLGTFYTAGAFFNPSYVHPNMISMNPTQKGGVSLHCPWGTLGPWEPMLQRAVDILQSGEINADRYVTHVYPLDQVKEAFEMAMNPYESIKVILEP